MWCDGGGWYTMHTYTDGQLSYNICTSQHHLGLQTRKNKNKIFSIKLQFEKTFPAEDHLRWLPSYQAKILNMQPQIFILQ